jgi:hypothetical protein
VVHIYFNRSKFIVTRVELLPASKFTGKLVKNKDFTGKWLKNGKNINLQYLNSKKYILGTHIKIPV